MTAGIRLSGFPLAVYGLIPFCEVFAYMPLGFFPGLYCSLVGFMVAKYEILPVHGNVCLKGMASFIIRNTYVAAGIRLSCPSLPAS